jgi:hypothetical protein
LEQHEPPADKVVTVFDQPEAGASAKLADTVVACATVSEQVLPLALLHAPPQDCNT